MKQSKIYSKMIETMQNQLENDWNDANSTKNDWNNAKSTKNDWNNAKSTRKWLKQCKINLKMIETMQNQLKDYWNNAKSTRKWLKRCKINFKIIEIRAFPTRAIIHSKQLFEKGASLLGRNDLKNPAFRPILNSNKKSVKTMKNQFGNM